MVFRRGRVSGGGDFLRILKFKNAMRLLGRIPGRAWRAPGILDDKGGASSLTRHGTFGGPK